jgi:ubiquinone/menaquinone biosynthesis C-methylase UbiE
MKPYFLNKPENGVYFLTAPKSDFEEVYLHVREKENRLLEDELVTKLPFLPSQHLHYSEWRKRQFTLKKFLKYKTGKKFQKILDIGCGNGWFTNQISSKTELTIGLDVGKEELEQAARCFEKDNLFFTCCSDLTLLPKNSFDLITFNASIHYFDLTPDFWENLNRLMTEFGEIHILDSPIYYQRDQEEAKKRSEHYFENIGEKDANSYYHHLIWNYLPSGYSIFYRPKKWKLKIFRNRSSFSWLMVQKRL